jgi:uncharacterized protein
VQVAGEGISPPYVLHPLDPRGSTAERPLVPDSTPVPHTAHTTAITGASGLIGSELTRQLQRAGERVLRLVRREAREPDEVSWDPARGTIDAAALEGVDAVVNLAGEPIAQRWTEAARRRIRDSRVEGTLLLTQALASLTHRPAVLISGSAMGIYGDRGDEELDETSATGSDWLAEIGAEWERATAPAEAAGIRVVHARTAIVLSPQGGALAKMLPFFRLGVGGTLGSGRQWMSWIALTDHVRAILHCMGRTDLSGPVNFTAPNPVRNDEFTKTLARVLRRPAFFPVPKLALDLVYGEMAEATILAGQRMRARRLLETGFDFRCPTLEGALRKELGFRM